MVTKNFHILVEKLDEWGSKFPAIMTSFNNGGFQMSPSKQACERTLVSYNGHVIAMAVLDGGHLGPEEACDYIL